MFFAGLQKEKRVYSCTRYIGALESHDGHMIYHVTGPLEKTGADFWSMVWSEKSAIIVMVTNLVEDERVSA